jgi:hypothetical protein
VRLDVVRARLEVADALGEVGGEKPFDDVLGVTVQVLPG